MALCVVCVAGLVSIGQTHDAEQRFGRTLDELHLISDQSRPGWGDHWSGPIEAATIAAWYHTRGYAAMLLDWTGDELVDESDTIELADYFGRTGMQAFPPAGTNDALLVDALARYVAMRYPNEFEILIYDPDFPSEYEQEIGAGFAAGVVPGILLTVEAESNFEAYSEAILGGYGVIVGVRRSDTDDNDYLAGRSFLFEPLEEGVHAVDFAWAKEDPWTPGAQGQVLQTAATSRSAWHIEIDGTWREAEFMAVLAPIDLPEAAPVGSCAGPDLTVSLADIWCDCELLDDGSLRCVAEAWFSIGNVGTEASPECEITFGTTIPVPWSLPVALGPLPPGGGTAAWIRTSYRPHEPTCPGTYSLEVDSADDIVECNEGDNYAEGSVCCPNPAGEGCPDLTISIDDWWCDCGTCDAGGTYCYYRFTYTVTNVGDAEAYYFDVCVNDMIITDLGPLDPGESVTREGIAEVVDCSDAAPDWSERLFFVDLEPGLRAGDPDYCNPYDDFAEFLATCAPSCTDLAVAIDHVQCNCGLEEDDRCPDGSRQTCGPIATVTVANVGETASEETTVEVDSADVGGFSTAAVPALAPGESFTVDVGLPGWYALFCGSAPVEFELVASVPSGRDCTPDNNRARLHVICDPPACPDLAVEAFINDCACRASERPDFDWECTADVTVSVTNIGEAVAENFEFHARTPHVGRSVDVAALEPGETATSDFAPVYGGHGAIPESIPVIAGATFLAPVLECDEDNNFVELAVPCNCTAADLAIYVSGQECECEWYDDPGGFCGDEPRKVCYPVLIVGVNNLSDVDSGEFTVSVDDGILARTTDSPGLGAGESDYFRFAFPGIVTCSAEPESFPVAAAIEVAEDCNPANNEMRLSLPCEPPPACPDLVISGISDDCSCYWTPQQAYTCDYVAEVTIFNAGVGDAGGFTVRLETRYGTDEVRVGGGLPAGESTIVRFELDVGDRSRVDYTIIVDSGGDVDECDEDNNEYEDSDRCS